jgi:hypothetical protein
MNATRAVSALSTEAEQMTTSLNFMSAWQKAALRRSEQILPTWHE